VLKGRADIVSFHNIQIIRRPRRDEVKLHIIVDKDMPVSRSHKLCHRLESLLRKRGGPCNVNVHFEPCGGDCKLCKMSCPKRA
jgi:divalent metal cation (Fe/Co/Zn/Cd) transporter